MIKKSINLPTTLAEPVIKNGIAYVKRAVNELWEASDTDHLKHSVINFYTGVELLLKARLMIEHWALIVADTRKADQSKFVQGDFISVTLDEARDRLKQIVNEPVPDAAMETFQALRRHRNKMVHFFHSAATSSAPPTERDAIVREQCRGWFFLRRLLQEQWHPLFSKYVAEIQSINSEMKQHRRHLEEVFQQVRTTLEEARKGGALIAECGICGFKALSLEGTEGPEEVSCAVCAQSSQRFVHECDNCNELIALAPCPDNNWACESCASSISLDELMESHADEKSYGEKNFHENGYALCCECTTHPNSVGTVNSEFFCFYCFTSHSSTGRCDYCNELTTDDLENSYYTGCSACEGQMG